MIMMDFESKNRKRASRRKRNFHAKALIEDKQFRPQRVEPKKKRQKLRVLDVYDEEEHQNWPEPVQDQQAKEDEE